ncbi:hypothetical protein Tco_0933772 [Tanacetum coccineum]
MSLTRGNNGQGMDEDAHEHVQKVLEIADLFNISSSGESISSVTPSSLENCQHDWNNKQKVHIFYNSLDIHTRQMLNSQGPIPKMPPGRAIESIQDMAGHSHKWNDEASIRRMSNDGSDGITTIINKLDSLGRDMKKLKESVHAIQVGCEIC